MNPLESPARPNEFSRIHSLAHRHARDRSGLYFVEGIRPFLQALDAGIPIDTVVFAERLLTNPFAAKRVRICRRAGTRVLRVTPEEFRAVSRADRASGVGAVLRQHWTPLREADPARGLCWLAAGLVRSDGNLGTILRTAEAAGAAGLILFGPETDPFDPAVVRASMAGLFHLRLVRTTLPEFSAWVHARGCRVLGTSPSAATGYTEVPVESPLVVMLGEERLGLTADERSACTHFARIPIVGRADSLNVGVAAGVMLYEILRRRMIASPPTRATSRSRRSRPGSGSSRSR